MALNTQIANNARNAATDAIAALANGGFLDIMDGSQPADANTAIGAQVRLARLGFGNPAFGASSNGVATANAIADDASADASGTATWFRVFKSDGTTAVWDGTVGLSAANLILAAVVIGIGARIQITSFTFQTPLGTGVVG